MPPKLSRHLALRRTREVIAALHERLRRPPLSATLAPRIRRAREALSLGRSVEPHPISHRRLSDGVFAQGLERLLHQKARLERGRRGGIRDLRGEKQRAAGQRVSETLTLAGWGEPSRVPSPPNARGEVGRDRLTTGGCDANACCSSGSGVGSRHTPCYTYARDQFSRSAAGLASHEEIQG